jgi:hypothetical protein
MMGKEEIRESYLSAVIRYNLLEKKEDKALVYISIMRFIAFAGGFVLIWIAFTISVTAGILLGISIIAAFLYLLQLFSLHSGRKAFLSNLGKINRNEAEALEGNLSAFEHGDSYVDPKHDFSYDIDLFGRSSLFQYLNRTVTDYGRDILATWLSDPYILSADLVKRQEAVKDLAPKVEWRQNFLASGMNTSLGKSDIADLIKWMEEPPAIAVTTVTRMLLWFLPAAALISFFLMVMNVIPYQVFVLIFLVNLLHIGSGLKKINRIHNSLTRKYNFLSSLNLLLHVFEKETFSSSVLNEIKANISGSKTSAAVSTGRLGKLIQAFDSRNNILVGFLLNGMLLWDYQCIIKLEKWKSGYKALFPVWLEMIGQMDAYSSLANHAWNNPDYAYPAISGASDVFSVKDMGHPLISETKRVCNDFSLGKNGTICIVSGANMSGKSTFLRTVAVNYILGMTGAPVCASEMNFVPSKLFTSMRTTDSLSENESYFYAELRRLNILKLKIELGEPVFFILDEILKGTNSADKSIGSKLFLKRIIERGGTGLMATHDTSIGKMEDDFSGIIVNKCFEIEINGDNISFDYKIHDGITQKMNAVFLMKQMGILD